MAGGRARRGRPFRIGIVGDDPFGATLDRRLPGKTVADSRWRSPRSRRWRSRRGATSLFLAGVRAAQRSAALSRRACSPSATAEFAARGGMIGFHIEDDKVRFEINAGAAERVELRISSQLLKLATRVIQRTECVETALPRSPDPPEAHPGERAVERHRPLLARAFFAYELVTFRRRWW